MKILAFAGSSSRQSINKQLVTHTAQTYFGAHDVEILDLNDYEMPIYSIDKEQENGLPQGAKDFWGKIGQADLLLISLAEHNGAYSTAFKNIFDWMSRIPNASVFQDKPILLMATSPGGRGGSSVLEIAAGRFPFNGGKVVGQFSLPSFQQHFHHNQGITDEGLRQQLEKVVEEVKATWLG